MSANPHPDADNHYQRLGVAFTASPAEITRAYRAAMKRVHPDRQRAAGRAVAEERAKRLNQAYAVLSRPVARAEYDRAIRAETVQDQLMNRYVGGFAMPQPGSSGGDGQRLRRAPTAAQRRERARSDHDALVSVVVAFGGITLAIVGLLVAWAVLSWAVGAVV
ncbi:MAG: hypothetical protein AVDCRST_MAG73-1040 [uncultured Thermomicrobiales bacterium]|uniref:J domain-containing protein n=1 Tax=uncultured Thermomicrobiales bacterium TaxID=1645740 RepID=A0A6J4TUL4_9BACT|nr:MAG: hypothetical protein AVDCRST_MAG73-1040 [uncultured Thermomicrobiales bacterium]